MKTEICVAEPSAHKSKRSSGEGATAYVDELIFNGLGSYTH